MLDLHYDLLSVIYQCYLRMDYSYLEKIILNYREDNIKGMIANLYFMNEEEMKIFLGDNHPDIDVLEMFKLTTSKQKEYISNTNIIYSIEGCDYIKDINELEELYNLGLRSFLLVWNNKNKYGSGIKGSGGLTVLGKEFITHAVKLGMTVDMSHMNKETFWDTYNLLKDLKNNGYDISVMASHSNSYKVLPHLRNLDDDELLALKELDALVGIVSYKDFICDKDLDVNLAKGKYIEHIKHIERIIGIDNIGVASDNMDFYLEFFNEESKNIFNYNNMASEIKDVLKDEYSDTDINKILYLNSYNKIFRRHIK